MPSTVSSKGESHFEPVSMGTHLAICTTVVNLGLQDSGQWGPKPIHYIAFEVPGERVKWEKDGKQHEGPTIIGSRYTSSLSPKANLRKHLESWRGRAFTEQELEGFDLFNLLGKPCLLSVVHNHANNKTYANIASIMGVPKGTEAPPQEGPTIKYDPSDANAAPDFASLAEWMQKAIEAGKSLSTKQTENPAPTQTVDDFDDDIPF